MSLRRVLATRYVTPLREGGSLPGIVEAEDCGMYVVKFRGAGQGPKALVAEVIVGELARGLGLPVPELVLVEVDPRMAVAEPDEEVQDLLNASAGDNLGIDYLPGSIGFEPIALEVDPALAAKIVWLDGLTDNVDRTWRNPNLLIWHKSLWLIDHGAALYWQHTWERREAAQTRELRGGDEHVLLGKASSLDDAHAALAPLLTRELLTDVMTRVPTEWWSEEAGDGAAYVEHLLARAAAPETWLAPLEVSRAAAL